MSFSTGFRKCKKCGKTLFALFDGELCDECEKAEQEPTSRVKNELKVELNELEPCDDAVSRQKALLSLTGEDLPKDRDKYIALVNERIKALPPVRPQEQTGHWIYDDECHEHGHCSECGYGRVDLVNGEPHNYCPNCGAKMVEPQESEE